MTFGGRSTPSLKRIAVRQAVWLRCIPWRRAVDLWPLCQGSAIGGGADNSAAHSHSSLHYRLFWNIKKYSSYSESILSYLAQSLLGQFWKSMLRFPDYFDGRKWVTAMHKPPNHEASPLNHDAFQTSKPRGISQLQTTRCSRPLNHEPFQKSKPWGTPNLKKTRHFTPLNHDAFQTSKPRGISQLQTMRCSRPLNHEPFQKSKPWGIPNLQKTRHFTPLNHDAFQTSKPRGISQLQTTRCSSPLNHEAFQIQTMRNSKPLKKRGITHLQTKRYSKPQNHKAFQTSTKRLYWPQERRQLRSERCPKQ